MTKPDFVYVTYIATTPEKVWQALVDTDVMRQYWCGLSTDCPGYLNVSDWQPGSRWEHQPMDGSGEARIVGTVIESRAPRRLVYTWARPADAEDASKHSRVAFDIELHTDGLVRLTVTHTDLERDPEMLAGVSGGWPKVLSNLKTLLETGQVLPGSPSRV